MPKPFSFSEPKVRALKAPQTGRVYYRDLKFPGLQVCVTAARSKTYYFVKRIDGKPTRMKLGSTKQLSVEGARTAAAALAGEIAVGNDPQTERRKDRDQPTIGELFEYWLKQAQARKRTWREDERLYNTYLKAWKSRRLADVTRRQVELWHGRIGEKKERPKGQKGQMLGGRYVANRALALLHAAYEKADRVGYTGKNPAAGVTKFPEEQRDRFLSGDDLKRFFDSLAEEPVLYQDFFTVSLLTGARRGNVQAMRWEDVNLASGLWRIPGNVSKNGQVILLPLIPTVVEILRRRLSEADSSIPWVFPSRTRLVNHLVEPRSSWERLCARAGLNGVRVHDLRRTLGSWQAAAGASMVVIGKSLGHRPGSPATAVYARLEMDPVRASVQTAADAMLVAGGQQRLLDVEPATEVESNDAQ